MSTTVDQRVVEMQFDNKQFESNVRTTMSTIDKLKQSLNFKGGSRGLDEIKLAAKNCDTNLSNLAQAVDSLQNKFSSLSVIGVTAIANLTNSAVNAGRRMVSALTIDPIKTGFQEYETQINAIQTILANTESKGSTLKDVNNALSELNTYADKTIYNFTEMTRNIGTFTAAGIDLDTSTTAIQGIANLAAVSGSTSQQASTAMYQLSQALASGTVKLQDWNSVVNAGMGGQVFQDALKKTAKAHGVAVDELIAKHGSFRESLSEGWITADILTETLGKMTQSGAAEYLSELTGISQDQIKAVQDQVDTNKDGSASYDQLAESMAKTGKISKDEALEILKMADTATNAATKVKTFTQLWDTLTEAAQSGWTQTWEIIVGDFEEAKELLTTISETVSDMINESAKARNDMLKGWKELGGRKDLIESFANVFKALIGVITPIKEAFKNIFPPITAQTLYNITAALKEFTAKLIVSDETADKIKRTFQGVFAVFDVFRKIIVTIANVIGSFLGGGAVSGVLNLFLTLTAAIGDFFTAIDKGFDTGGISGAISNIAGSISGAIGAITNGFDGFGGVLEGISKSVGGIFSSIWNAIKDVVSWISETVSIGDIATAIVGGGLVVGLKKFLDIVSDLKEVMDGGIIGLIFGSKDGEEEAKGFKESFSDVLGSVNESLQAFTSGIKVASLVAIAAAIGILAHALKTISELDAVDVAKSLGAMAAMMTMLSIQFKSLLKSLSTFKAKGLIRASVSLILVAEAINILSDALVKIGSLSLDGVAKGLLGVYGSLFILTKAIEYLDGVKIPVSTTIVIITLAESCKILADAMSAFGSMSWEEVARGVVGMGFALGELVGALAILNKIGGKTSIAGSVSLLILVEALDEISDALKNIGSLSWDEIKRGLAGMGGALIELVAAVDILGRIGGLSGILGSVSIVIISTSLGKIADALMTIGYMSWDEIKRGLAGMGGALGELVIAIGILGQVGGLASILGSVSIAIVSESLDEIANALTKIGYMSWEDIERGLAGMGGALLELVVAIGMIGEIGGLSSLIGAASIALVTECFDEITTTLKNIGSLSWDEIKRGLVGLGGALIELVAAIDILGQIGGLSSIIGSGSIFIVMQGLEELANAFVKIGSLSWDEIKRGLAGMGGALGEVAFISGMLGSLAGLPALLGSGSLLIAIQGLGDLADAFVKFGSMSWDEIEHGLRAMGGALGEVAFGSLINTLSAIGGASIAVVAEPLGTLADSMKKWSDVDLPEDLGKKLELLASGVSAFTFDGWGADTIATVSEPLGTLADSVNKWKDVTVSETLGDQLKTLADGIGAFGTAFAAGISIDTIASPLGTLADSVNKWKDVTVPEDLGDQMKRLSEGIASLDISFGSGATLATMSGPIDTLGNAVKKFSKINIPSDISDQMKSLGSGISEIGTAVSGITTVVGETLTSLATGVDKLSSTISKIGSVDTDKVDNFVKAIKKLGNIDVDTSSLSDTASKVSSSVDKMMSSINKTVSSGKSSISDSMTTAMSGMSSAIKSTTSSVTSSAGDLITSLTSTISSKTSSVNASFKSLVSGAANAVKGQYSSMSSAGNHLGDGLVAGIKAKESAAYQAGYNLGRQAVKGEKDGQKSKSPSRATMQAGRWLGEGLVIGMQQMSHAVYSAGKSMGENAVDSLSGTLNSLSVLEGSGFDVNPTISPVVDLSNVQRSSAAINSMLGSATLGVSANLESISSLMGENNQNGVNDDVVDAINKLNRSINSLERPSYNINGITYDDGSNVTSAIETLVRAATVERRI